MHKVYIVHAGYQTQEFERLDEAARHWDRVTFSTPASNYATADKPAGISVQEFHGDIMVRDGWVVMINQDGIVYINPLGA